MRDRDVREIVRRWLEVAQPGDHDTLMLDELGILNGATRIDIALERLAFHLIQIECDPRQASRWECCVSRLIG
jgi:hypothetical protein